MNNDLFICCSCFAHAVVAGNVKEKLSLHTAIIDKSIVWYGSVNYLGYNAEDDKAIKIAGSSIAGEVIEILYE